MVEVLKKNLFIFFDAPQKCDGRFRRVREFNAWEFVMLNPTKRHQVALTLIPEMLMKYGMGFRRRAKMGTFRYGVDCLLLVYLYSGKVHNAHRWSSGSDSKEGVQVCTF